MDVFTIVRPCYFHLSLRVAYGLHIRGVGVVIFQRIESTTLGSNEAIVPNKAREENRSRLALLIFPPRALTSAASSL